MSDVTHVVGWTLIHFLWQGGVLALLMAVALRLSRRGSPHLRYLIACAGLAGMLMAPLVTAAVLSTPGVEEAVMAGLPEPVNSEGSVLSGPVTATGGRLVWGRVVTSRLDAWLPLVVLGWLGGVSLLLIRLAGGLWRVHHLHQAALRQAASCWQAAGERIATRLGLRRAVHIVSSRDVDTPTAIGWLRPVVLLPIAALANLSPSQVEAILAHELVHIRRHDYLVNLAQTLAETLLFFHPGVWWLSHRIRVEREQCCDDVAVAVCGDPAGYAAALTELETWRAREHALALAATTGRLLPRVRRILGLPTGHEPRTVSGLMTLCVTLLVVMGIGISGPWTNAPGRASAAIGQAEPIASPDTFDWQLYPIDHFDVYYYPALEADLAPVAEAAERAYAWISAELQYQLAFKVPLILFKTRADFEQQEMVSEIPERVMREITSFSEPRRDRVVILLDADPRRWYGQITHELTHIFQFDIIPGFATPGRLVPTWITEGMADYMVGTWEPAHLQELRELVIADRVPKLSTLTDTGRGRLDVSVGHVAFEFIEAAYGKERIRQFLLELRRDVVDGTDDLYQATFFGSPEAFDEAFARYLRERFR